MLPLGALSFGSSVPVKHLVPNATALSLLLPSCLHTIVGLSRPLSLISLRFPSLGGGGQDLYFCRQIPPSASKRVFLRLLRRKEDE